MKNLYNLRVADVLDDYDVVLNAGSDDDVGMGMIFVVYSLGNEIFDPETNESLGQLEIVKGTVKVKHIQARISTATSNETEVIRVPKRSLNALAALTGDTEDRRVTSKLRDVVVGDYARRIS